MIEENTIPVWSGCFAPLQLVMLDGEEWSPSIEEINSGSYDAIKLFRSSLNVDVGIAPLSLIVLFDGTLVLPACADIPKNRALVIFNKHLTSMLLGGMLVEEVAPDDVTPGSLNFWGYHRHHAPTGHYTKLSQSLRMARGGPDELIMLYRPKTITKKQYLQTHSIGMNLSKKLPGNLSTVLLPACTSYVNEKWERSLILGWTSIELIIEKMWTEKVLSGPEIQGISRKRRKDFLSDTRTWSSSTRIELLWQRGHITDATYALADKARAARNAFIHSADECPPEAARSAVEATLNLIGSVANEADLEFDASKLMVLLDGATTQFREPVTDDKGRLLVEPLCWRYPDPAPGFKDWGDRPFEKIPEIQLQPLEPKI
jgi:hypothetical protein